MSLGPSDEPQLEDAQPEDVSACCIAALDVSVFRMFSDTRLLTLDSSCLAMQRPRATNMPLTRAHELA
jgi:hypothetical protein